MFYYSCKFTHRNVLLNLWTLSIGRHNIDISETIGYWELKSNETQSSNTQKIYLLVRGKNQITL